MLKKKLMATGMAFAMVLSFSTINPAQVSAASRICTVEDCNRTGSHRHNGITYKGHTIDDGHDYHQLCGLSSCSKTGSHKHDGVCYLGHSGNTSGSGHHSGGRGHHSGRHH